MENIENLEQLKRKMIWVLDSRKNIPEEVTGQIQNMFNRLEEKYSEMRCNNGSIQEYLQESVYELVQRLEKGIGDKRKTQQFEDVQAFLAGVENDIEQKLESEEQKRKDTERQKQISEIGNNGPNNIGITLNSMDQIVDVLKNVQSRQNRILAARGYTDRQIEEINDEMQHFIMQLRSRNEEGIHAAFQEDNVKIRQELLQAYEQYVMQRGEEQQEVEAKPNAFKESLSAGISLEQQSANAAAFASAASEKEDTDRQTHRQSLESLFK